MALYNKYRPKTFEDVIGQPFIVQTLRNQISASRSTHSYLFTGSRGTGKTTCAKILAKAVNCLSPENGSPCLKCENCIAIENGSPDLLEIDAASNSTVESVRDLIERVNYAPSELKKRVYIIDEVHGLSPGAANALLKTIEEPPPHAMFIFATTESHKVLETIVSRCQRFEFRRIPEEDAAKRIEDIAVKENFKIEHSAALLLSRLSDGAMRTALSLLEGAVGKANKQIQNEEICVTENVVRDVCGVPDINELSRIIVAAKEYDPVAAVKIIAGFFETGKSMQLVLSELMVFLRDLMIAKTTEHNNRQDFNNLCRRSEKDAEEIFRLANLATLDEIFSFLDIVGEYYEKTKSAFDLRVIAEMCVVKICSKREFEQPRQIVYKTTVPSIQSQNEVLSHRENYSPPSSESKEKEPLHTNIANHQKNDDYELWKQILPYLLANFPVWDGFLKTCVANFNGQTLILKCPSENTKRVLEVAKNEIIKIAKEAFGKDISVSLVVGDSAFNIPSAKPQSNNNPILKPIINQINGPYTPKNQERLVGFDADSENLQSFFEKLKINNIPYIPLKTQR